MSNEWPEKRGSGPGRVYQQGAASKLTYSLCFQAFLGFFVGHKKAGNCFDAPSFSTAILRYHKLSDLTKMDSLGVLEARSLKARCQEGYFLPETQKEKWTLSGLLWLLAIPGISASHQSLPPLSHGLLISLGLDFSIFIRIP